MIIPSAFSGVTAAYILGMSRAVGETMVVAIAAGQQAKLAYNPLEGAATITAYIVQISLGDLPHDFIGYLTIFAAGLTLFLITFTSISSRFGCVASTARPTEASPWLVDAATSPVLDEAIAKAARWTDGGFALLGLGVLIVTMLVLISLIATFVQNGLGRIDWEFLTSYPSRRPGQAGILSAWIGTCLVMIVTAALAVPLGVCAGVYLEEYAPKNKLTAFIEINVTNLAGIPSIIYGLLALGLFVQTFAGQTGRRGHDPRAFDFAHCYRGDKGGPRAIPLEFREAAYGLGADKWQTIGSTSCHLLGRTSSPARSSGCRVLSVRPHRLSRSAH